MDSKEIQKRIDVMPAAMSAKGLRSPEARFEIIANEGVVVLLHWRAISLNTSTSIFDYNSGKYEWLRGDTVEEALGKAEDFISALPSGDETKHRQFMDALGGLIDVGRENGIEVAFVNPLVETMKRLSENVLTFQPQSKAQSKAQSKPQAKAQAKAQVAA